MKKIIITGLLIIIYSCTNSADLNTPREITTIGDSQSGINTSFSVRQNNQLLKMELIKNRFLCTINGSDTNQILKIRIELQNQELGGAITLNSIYMRSDTLKADGNFYSLSGDPVNVNNLNASKLIFRLPDYSLLPIIPSQINGSTDNFQISIAKIDNSRKFYGKFIYHARLKNPAKDSVDVTGDFTIEY